MVPTPRRTTPVLTALGVLVALWLGLAAPAVSPVAAGPPVAAAVSATVDQAPPGAGVLVVPDPGPRGRGGR